MTLAEAFVAAKPRLQAALDRAGGEYDLDDIWDMVARRDAQLWHNEAFSGVTQVVIYPRKKVVLVHLAGGDLDALLEAAGPGGDLEKFAKIVGADGIEIQGRRGWVRAMADIGYREQYVRVYKEL